MNGKQFHPFLFQSRFLPQLFIKQDNEMIVHNIPVQAFLVKVLLFLSKKLTKNEPKSCFPHSSFLSAPPCPLYILFFEMVFFTIATQNRSMFQNNTPIRNTITDQINSQVILYLCINMKANKPVEFLLLIVYTKFC